ncbi:MAG: NUDIX hydrolase [Bacteroidales bacterium]|jgi:8-oxo-dGTP diphosphatase|nr:NUDIX hydrolase [Bacteroidales bacterium]
MPYTYEYPRPAVCVDIIVLTSDLATPEILLIKRKFEPFKDHWALPGGFVDIDEELDQAAYRELDEETSLADIKLEQFKTFGKIGRDPRGRTISVVYFGFISENQKHLTKANDDASETKWFSIMSLPDLAFDHLEIINEATEKISK